MFIIKGIILWGKPKAKSNIMMVRCTQDKLIRKISNMEKVQFTMLTKMYCKAILIMEAATKHKFDTLMEAGTGDKLIISYIMARDNFKIKDKK